VRKSGRGDLGEEGGALGGGSLWGKAEIHLRTGGFITGVSAKQLGRLQLMEQRTKGQKGTALKRKKKMEDELIKWECNDRGRGLAGGGAKVGGELGKLSR